MTHDDETVERELLREALSALTYIADGQGKCSECGAWAIGAVGGVVGYGCCESPRATWEAVDPKDTARAAADKIRAALEHQQKGEGL